MKRFTTAFVILVLASACGHYPPIVESARDFEKLSLDEESIRARGLADEDIHALERMKNLQHLDFTGGWAVKEAKITDDGVKVLASLNLPLLTSIHIGYNERVGDRAVGYLAGMQPLTMLALFDCPNVTDAALVDLSKRGSVVYLLLNGCSGVTDEGVLQLVNLRGLESLSLDGCQNVTAETVTTLRRMMPSVGINKNDDAWKRNGR
ncbi:MAG: hypothetical protein ACI8TQ_000502 [Planctomycetota bacterium]